MSLCPHGYTAFWDCPICEEPMGTAMPHDPSERFMQNLPCGCSYEQGQYFFCVRHQPLHGDHTRPVRGCDLCDSAMDEARTLQSERPWENA